MKTFEEILKETIEDDFRTQHVTTESPESRAAKAYAEQFIDAAVEECNKRIIPGHNVQAPSMINAGEAILNLKKYLRFNDSEHNEE